MAKCAGFCYGVKRAVETVKKIKTENISKKVWVLGELIHNSHVIKELDKMGIMTVNELPSDETGICVIRSHGMAETEIKNISGKGFEVIDLTCPDVKKVQQKAAELAKEHYLVLILGKPVHPEVIAIKANAQMYSENVFVIPDLKSLEDISHKIKSIKKAGIVIQTTQQQALLQAVVNYLIPVTKELKIYNTICQSTAMRQEEAQKLAETSDLMVVVGSKKSANTSQLAEILKKITQTIHIETADDLSKYGDIIKKAENISVTSGASTPDNIIQDVINGIENI